MLARFTKRCWQKSREMVQRLWHRIVIRLGLARVMNPDLEPIRITPFAHI